MMRVKSTIPARPARSSVAGAATGSVELLADAEHFRRVVLDGIAAARGSVDVLTADFKAMLVPEPGKRKAVSIVQLFRDLVERGVEIRVLHAGVPSGPALRELRHALPQRLTIRRCPRLHAKAVIIDCAAMYLGSANLTGAGLGAKAARKRNFELGVWTTSASLIDAVETYFNTLWEGERCASCGRRDVCPVPLEEPTLLG